MESDVGQAEIQGMKAEIHRMEVNSYSHKIYIVLNQSTVPKHEFVFFTTHSLYLNSISTHWLQNFKPIQCLIEELNKVSA